MSLEKFPNVTHPKCVFTDALIETVILLTKRHIKALPRRVLCEISKL